MTSLFKRTNEVLTLNVDPELAPENENAEFNPGIFQAQTIFGNYKWKAMVGIEGSFADGEENIESVTFQFATVISLENMGLAQARMRFIFSKDGCKLTTVIIDKASDSELLTLKNQELFKEDNPSVLVSQLIHEQNGKFSTEIVDLAKQLKLDPDVLSELLKDHLRASLQLPYISKAFYKHFTDTEITPPARTIEHQHFRQAD